jgi:hypothetical protein
MARDLEEVALENVTTLRDFLYRRTKTTNDLSVVYSKCPFSDCNRMAPECQSKALPALDLYFADYP